MIRPFTCLCLLLACGSGLYLYQSKHRVELLDQQIEAVVHQTQAARSRIGVLRAEWALENDPERLTELAGKFLTLHATTPAQFTTLADLDARLPPVPAPEAPAPDTTTDQPPVAETAPPDGPPLVAPLVAAARPVPMPASGPTPVKSPVKIAAAKARPARDQPARAERGPVTPVSITTLGRPPAYASPYAPPSYARPPAPLPATPPVPVVASALGMARMLPPPAPYASAN